jgi:hypothetical protein
VSSLTQQKKSYELPAMWQEQAVNAASASSLRRWRINGFVEWEHIMENLE